MTKSEQFKELLKLTTSSLTREEFLNSFKTVLDFVKKAVQDLTQKYQQVISRTEVEISSKLSSLEEKVDTKLSKVKNGLDGQNGERGSDGKDGQDSDPQIVAEIASKMTQEALKPLIPTIEAIEADIPRLGAPIRDSLELLQGNERLEISAIKDLQDKLDELKKEFGKTRFVGGGTSDIGVQASLARLIKTETPVGNIDGVNKTYTVNLPINAVLSFGINGMVIHDSEYTISGNIITFITEIPAGLSGTNFRITYV
jgi:hypothetical protein